MRSERLGVHSYDDTKKIDKSQACKSLADYSLSLISIWGSSVMFRGVSLSPYKDQKQASTSRESVIDL